MANLSYEEGKKRVIYGLVLLAIITLIEVTFSLMGKGHILSGLGIAHHKVAFYIIGFILVALSLYKARFIILEFMHLEHEANALKWTLAFPFILLLWAMIAFMQEGHSWKNRRFFDGDYKNKKKEMKEVAPQQEGGVMKFDENNG